MNARQEEEQPQQREGLGGRVRRFVETELSRALNSDKPEATAPSDAGHDAAASDPPTSTAASDPPTSTAASDPPTSTAVAGASTATTEESRRLEENAADDSAERVGLLNNPASLRAEWQQVQGTFVDDPQRAVHEASMLVERTLQEIRENVSRGDISDPTSTEDLRVSFQRYREFFQRLLSA
jgi:hypothetical protein